MSHAGHEMMDHSGMGHGGMDHGGMGHGDMGGGHGGMESQCSMSMIFTWDTTDLCVVFKWWHIRTTVGLWLSLATIVALGAGYEYLRAYTRAHENRARDNGESNGTRNDEEPLLTTASTVTTSAKDKRAKLTRAILYGAQVAYSFFLM